MHTWRYRGKKLYAGCPRCRSKVTTSKVTAVTKEVLVVRAIRLLKESEQLRAKIALGQPVSRTEVTNLVNNLALHIAPLAAAPAYTTRLVPPVRLVTELGLLVDSALDQAAKSAH